MADLTAHVHAALAKHYPDHVLGWVKRATWKRDPAVPLSRIDMSRRPGGRDPQKVAGIAQAVKDGKPMPPVVLVDTGESKLQIADGYHRTLGFQHAGKATIPALIASGVGAHGPWEKRMHDAKLNLTAGHVHVIDLAGTCTGPGPCDTSSFGEGKNWVNKVGGLPDYIRAVAHAFRRKGLSESEAIQRAVGVVKNWAEGKGNVSAATRARAAKAVAEWEAKKAAAHSLTADATVTVDLAADPVFATTDGPSLTGPAHRYHHGWIRIDASAPTAVERATRAVTTDGHALLHGMGMVPAAQRVIERVKAAGHTATVKRVDVAGRPHVHISRGGATSLTAASAATVDLAFTEQLHPRGGKGTAAGGKFVAKNSGSAPPANMAANIKDFQRRAGLPVTGVIDAATAAKIHAAATAKGGGGGRGKTAKSKAKHAAAVARKQITQHVTAVNALGAAQRAQYRAKVPTPPAGYVWSKNNTLRRAANTGALRGVLATIGAKSISKTPAAPRRTTGVGSGGQRTASSLTRHH